MFGGKRVRFFGLVVLVVLIGLGWLIWANFFKLKTGADYTPIVTKESVCGEIPVSVRQQYPGTTLVNVGCIATDAQIELAAGSSTSRDAILVRIALDKATKETLVSLGLDKLKDVHISYVNFKNGRFSLHVPENEKPIKNAKSTNVNTGTINYLDEATNKLGFIGIAKAEEPKVFGAVNEPEGKRTQLGGYFFEECDSLIDPATGKVQKDESGKDIVRTDCLEWTPEEKAKIAEWWQAYEMPKKDGISLMDKINGRALFVEKQRSVKFQNIKSGSGPLGRSGAAYLSESRIVMAFSNDGNDEHTFVHELYHIRDGSVSGSLPTGYVEGNTELAAELAMRYERIENKDDLYGKLGFAAFYPDNFDFTALRYVLNYEKYNRPEQALGEFQTNKIGASTSEGYFLGAAIWSQLHSLTSSAKLMTDFRLNIEKSGKDVLNNTGDVSVCSDNLQKFYGVQEVANDGQINDIQRGCISDVATDIFRKSVGSVVGYEPDIWWNRNFLLDNPGPGRQTILSWIENWNSPKIYSGSNSTNQETNNLDKFTVKGFDYKNNIVKTDTSKYEPPYKGVGHFFEDTKKVIFELESRGEFQGSVRYSYSIKDGKNVLSQDKIIPYQAPGNQVNVYSTTNTLTDLNVAVVDVQVKKIKVQCISCFNFGSTDTDRKNGIVGDSVNGLTIFKDSSNWYGGFRISALDENGRELYSRNIIKSSGSYAMVLSRMEDYIPTIKLTKNYGSYVVLQVKLSKPSSYYVRYSNKPFNDLSGVVRNTILRINDSKYSFFISNLSYKTKYYFQVVVIDMFGNTQLSIPTEVDTYDFETANRTYLDDVKNADLNKVKYVGYDNLGDTIKVNFSGLINSSDDYQSKVVVSKVKDGVKSFIPTNVSVKNINEKSSILIKSGELSNKFNIGEYYIVQFNDVITNDLDGLDVAIIDCCGFGQDNSIFIDSKFISDNLLTNYLKNSAGDNQGKSSKYSIPIDDDIQKLRNYVRCQKIYKFYYYNDSEQVALRNECLLGKYDLEQDYIKRFDVYPSHTPQIVFNDFDDGKKWKEFSGVVGDGVVDDRDLWIIDGYLEDKTTGKEKLWPTKEMNDLNVKATNLRYGDVNMDGKLDQLDVVRAMEINKDVIKGSELEKILLDVAPMSKDGKFGDGKFDKKDLDLLKELIQKPGSKGLGLKDHNKFEANKLLDYLKIKSVSTGTASKN